MLARSTWTPRWGSARWRRPTATCSPSAALARRASRAPPPGSAAWEARPWLASRWTSGEEGVWAAQQWLARSWAARSWLATGLDPAGWAALQWGWGAVASVLAGGSQTLLGWVARHWAGLDTLAGSWVARHWAELVWAARGSGGRGSEGLGLGGELPRPGRRTASRADRDRTREGGGTWAGCRRGSAGSSRWWRPPASWPWSRSSCSTREPGTGRCGRGWPSCWC